MNSQVFFESSRFPSNDVLFENPRQALPILSTGHPLLPYHLIARFTLHRRFWADSPLFPLPNRRENTAAERYSKRQTKCRHRSGVHRPPLPGTDAGHASGLRFRWHGICYVMGAVQLK
jgi:hypothetical protein